MSRIGGEALLLTPALWLLPASGRAAQTFYVGPNNGTWTNGNNWDAGTPPVAGDDAVVGGFVPSRTGNVNVTFDANYASGSALNSVTLDSTGTTGSVIVNQTASGTALYATNQYIGTTTARNIYSQTTGSNIATSGLYLGYNAAGNGTYNLGGTGSIGATNSNATEYIGYSGSGTFTQTGGTNTCNGLFIGSGGSNGSSGTGIYNLSGGSLSVGYQFQVGSTAFSPNVTGTFNQTGGTSSSGGFFPGDISVGRTGVYNLSAGSLTAASGVTSGNTFIDNSGTFNLSGGTLAAQGTNGTIINSGTLNISNAPTVTGVLTNNSGGTVKATGATYALATTFTNNGLYQSAGGSTQTFNALTIGTTGAMQGGAGETFIVNRNLTNNSAQSSTFDLSAARLTLAGSGVNHRVAWTGAEFGPTAPGYANNFAVGTLELASGGLLSLLDGDSTPGGALYVHALMLDDGVAQIASIATSGAMNIYYEAGNPANAYLNNQVYALNGGGILAPAVIPEPSTWALLLAASAGGLGAAVRRRKVS